MRQFEFWSQRVCVECRNEDSTRCYSRISHYVIRTLTDKREQTGIQQHFLYSSTVKCSHALLAEFFKVLFRSSLHGDAHHLASCPTFHACHYAAYRRNKFHFWMILVYKQGSSGHHIFLFLNDHFRSHACKIIGTQSIESRLFHSHHFRSRLTFQVYVQAFTQLN